MSYLSTSKASPNDTGIVIVIIIIVIIGEVSAVQHCGGIIAQSFNNRSMDSYIEELIDLFWLRVAIKEIVSLHEEKIVIRKYPSGIKS